MITISVSSQEIKLQNDFVSMFRLARFILIMFYYIRPISCYLHAMLC